MIHGYGVPCHLSVVRQRRFDPESMRAFERPSSSAQVLDRHTRRLEQRGLGRAGASRRAAENNAARLATELRRGDQSFSARCEQIARLLHRDGTRADGLRLNSSSTKNSV